MRISINKFNKILVMLMIILFTFSGCSFRGKARKSIEESVSNCINSVNNINNNSTSINNNDNDIDWLFLWSLWRKK